MSLINEPYAYFQPGDIVFVMKGERAASSARARSATTSSKQETASPAVGSTGNESTGFPSGSLENHPVGEKPVYDGDDALAYDQKVEALLDWSRSVAKDLGFDVTIERRKERETYFPGVSTGPIYAKPEFEAAPLQTENAPQAVDKEKESLSPAQGYTSPVVAAPGAFSMITAEVRQNVKPEELDKNPERYFENKNLALLIAKLDDNRTAPQLMESGIDLYVASPNWLSAPASEWGGGGGPGSRPTPYKGKPESAPYQFQLPKELEDLCASDPQRRGAGVKVIILDTAPSIHELVWAYERYHKVNPEKQREHHPLIESLLKPGGPLTIHPASPADLFRMRAVHLRDHNYNMTAHGLFVAGIIHSIAPAAEIHLYEVLNSEGVGDLTTIHNTLLKISQEYTDPRLVINCSLTLYVPFNGNPKTPNAAARVSSTNSQPIAGHRLTNMYPDFLQKIMNDPGWVLRTCSAIHDLCDAVYKSNSKVIAAAGNDWLQKGDAVNERDPGRPEARALASFGSVQGVGALPRTQPQTATAPNGKYLVSSYSDLSDDPSSVGITTLGGEGGESNGVLGVYVGEFPAPDKRSIWQQVIKFFTNMLGDDYTGAPENKNNWAWWAGTSFATPILTGCIAAVLSNSSAIPSTEEAIHQMYDCHAIINDKTTYQEDLLNVTQGNQLPS